MKKECKNCGSRVEHFNIDYDAGIIRCFYCGSELPVKMFFPLSNISKFANTIPEERRDEFMNKLGYEKKEGRKTANIAFYLMVFITLISSLNKFLKNKDDTGEIASLIFMAIIFVITAVKAYRDLKIPKYVKKDQKSIILN